MAGDDLHTFEFEFRVRGLWLDSDRGHIFRVADQPMLEVLLSPHPQDLNHPLAGDAIGIARLQRKVRASTILEALAMKAAGEAPNATTTVQLPQASLVPNTDSPPPRRGFYIEASTVLHTKPEWPQAFQDFRFDVYRQLHRAASLLARNLRWRSGAPITHEPIEPKSFRWVGPEVEVELGVPKLFAASHRNPIVLSDEAVELMTERTSTDTDEPIGHTLLVEAWELHSENPRAALALAVTALESATKRYIARQAPDAAWLAEESPSPPLERIVSEYLPTISNPATLAVETLRFEKVFIDRIRILVRKRNELVHRGKAKLEQQSLANDLRMISDYLWLLDALEGNSWAMARISRERRAWFGLPERTAPAAS